jgi:uncharacterized membrane protein YvbJ
MPPESCPNCGADVPRNAKACPECGACEETGWAEDSHTAGLDLPEDSFDYNEFVQREFGPKKRLPRGISWLWWTVSIVLVVLFVLFLLRGWW